MKSEHRSPGLGSVVEEPVHETQEAEGTRSASSPPGEAREQKSPSPPEVSGPPSDSSWVEVRVWDLPTRLLHWANAALVLSLAATGLFQEVVEEWYGEAGEEALLGVHVALGYAFLVTLGLRILWGFLGNRYARWTDVLPLSRQRWEAIRRDLRWHLSGFRGEPPHAVGHHALASLVYTGLFALLMLQAGTGWLLSGLSDEVPASVQWFPGWFGGLGEAVEDPAEEIHEGLVWGILGLVFLHWAGVAIHEFRQRAGLVWSMITGRRRVRREWLSPKEQGD